MYNYTDQKVKFSPYRNKTWVAKEESKILWVLYSYSFL